MCGILLCENDLVVGGLNVRLDGAAWFSCFPYLAPTRCVSIWLAFSYNTVVRDMWHDSLYLGLTTQIWQHLSFQGRPSTISQKSAAQLGYGRLKSTMRAHATKQLKSNTRQLKAAACRPGPRSVAEPGQVSKVARGAIGGLSSQRHATLFPQPCLRITSLMHVIMGRFCEIFNAPDRTTSCRESYSLLFSFQRCTGFVACARHCLRGRTEKETGLPNL